MNEFSNKTRIENLKRLQSENFDLLIVGGGITGAGVARDAALRGMKVGLIEAQDFAEGTSSRSSKLIHGGIRYLENLEFKLVFEALNERQKLFRMAPHLVHPLRFMIPIYETSRVSMLQMGLGMWLYDMLSLFRAPQLHERLNSAHTLKRMGILEPKSLAGSYIYSDAYMDDDRLTIETLRSAHEAGAIIANYVRATSSYTETDSPIVRSIGIRDEITGLEGMISTQRIVSCTGPWTDITGEKFEDQWKKILRPTKGIHFTLKKDRIALTSAVVMGAEDSNRIVFAIPRDEMIIIGTTDTDYQGDPGKVSANSEDIQYLLNITARYFPGAKVTADDIINAYAGVRPLVQDGSQSEGKTSREHTILTRPNGITYVAGGKYTTYRHMAEEIVDHILRENPPPTGVKWPKKRTDIPLNPYTSPDALAEAMQAARSSNDPILIQLAKRHGMEAFEMRVKFPNYNYLETEFAHALDKTMCLKLKDFCTRRSPIHLTEANGGIDQLESLLTVLVDTHGLAPQDAREQLIEYKSLVEHDHEWRQQMGQEKK